MRVHRNAVAQVVVELHFCCEYLESFGGGVDSLCECWKDFVLSSYRHPGLSPPQGTMQVELQEVSTEFVQENDICPSLRRFEYWGDDVSRQVVDLPCLASSSWLRVVGGLRVVYLSVKNVRRVLVHSGPTHQPGIVELSCSNVEATAMQDEEGYPATIYASFMVSLKGGRNGKQSSGCARLRSLAGCGVMAYGAPKLARPSDERRQVSWHPLELLTFTIISRGA